MNSLILSLVLAQQPPILPTPVVEYASGRGVSVRYDGVEVIRGSFFQYYKGNWEKGLWSSNWNPVTVKKVGADTEVTYASKDGVIYGSLRYEPKPGELTVRGTFGYKGEGSANVENTVGFLWAPLFERGSVLMGGKETRKMSSREGSATDPKTRAFGEPHTSVTATSPLANFDFQSKGAPLECFDARGYRQDWAERGEFLWIGHSRITVPTGKTSQVVTKILFKGQKAVAEPKTVKLPPGRPAPVIVPTGPEKVIPEPKKVELTDKFLELPDPFVPRPMSGIDTRLPMKGLPGQAYRILNRRFPVKFPDDSFQFAALANPQHADAYRITIRDKVLVESNSLIAKHRALGVLASLMRAKDGKVALPQGTISDWPSMDWRGGHLFASKMSFGMQSIFAERVLTPFGFNKMVLQADRTNWKEINGKGLPGLMEPKELAFLFNVYRELGLDPIPLIQSHGHMEWLFANPDNLQYAFNKEIPYSINPENPEAVKVVESIWDQVVETLKPSALHFGLDEVAMRGYPNDPKLVTKHWKKIMEMVDRVSKKHQRPAMMWGDMVLAPGEAPDAMNGHDLATAKERRAAIPKGTYITDWHYINNADPKIYKSLGILKSEGFMPIGSGWNRQENIAGLVRASREAGGGYLQTTWAGYLGDMNSLVENPTQYAAFLLAGDYMWTGRVDLPKDIGYDPVRELGRRMFYGKGNIAGLNGLRYGDASREAPIRIGDILFDPLAEPISTSSLEDDPKSPQPTEITIEVPYSKGLGSVRVAIQTTLPGDYDEIVGTIRMKGRQDIILRYGRDIRAGSDSSAVLLNPNEGGWTSLNVPVGSSMDSKFTIRAASKVNGIRIGGVSMVPASFELPTR